MSFNSSFEGRKPMPRRMSSRSSADKKPWKAGGQCYDYRGSIKAGGQCYDYITIFANFFAKKLAFLSQIAAIFIIKATIIYAGGLQSLRWQAETTPLDHAARASQNTAIFRKKLSVTLVFIGLSPKIGRSRQK
jgi:hypothetical protein